MNSEKETHSPGAESRPLDPGRDDIDSAAASPLDGDEPSAPEPSPAAPGRTEPRDAPPATRSGDARGRDRRDRHRPRRDEPRERGRGGAPQAPADRLEQRALRLEQELADVFFRLVDRRKAAAGDRSPVTRASVRLELKLEPPADGGPSGGLWEELAKASERYVGERAAFPFGRTYCHWCRSFECEHSVPPDPRSVFRGYSPTGQPVWQELMSLLVEWRHPRVGDIAEPPYAPVTVVQGGHELSSEQLAVYGKRSPTYQILAQVVLGYLPFPDGLGLPSGGRQRSPVALTIQAVVTGGSGRPPVLNLLGRLPGGAPTWQAIEESPDRRISDALASARRSLQELALIRGNVRRRQREGERYRRAFGVLSRLARNLERIFRQRTRRTLHSEDRHQDRQRPTSTAFRDALHASPESIYRDVEERTWVVVGPKNRVHVFNDRALHITSVTYSGESVRHRTTRGKWLTPRPDELSAFQEALRAKAAT